MSVTIRIRPASEVGGAEEDKSCYRVGIIKLSCGWAGHAGLWVWWTVGAMGVLSQLQAEWKLGHGQLQAYWEGEAATNRITPNPIRPIPSGNCYLFWYHTIP